MQHQDGSWLSLVASNEPLAEIVADGLFSNAYCKDVSLALPAQWHLNVNDKHRGILCYNSHIPLPGQNGRLRNKNNSFFVLSNARFLTNVDYARLRNVVSTLNTDIVMVNVEHDLAANQEKLRLTSHNQLAGIRRIYADSAQKTPIPSTWPCYVFIRHSALSSTCDNRSIPANFDDFIRSLSKRAAIASVNVGGTLLDIETPQGLLAFLFQTLKSLCPAGVSHCCQIPPAATKRQIPFSARCYGTVVLGKNVLLGENTILIGPTVIGDDSVVGNGAIVAKAVIGSSVSVAANEFVHNRLLVKTPDNNCIRGYEPQMPAFADGKAARFRKWGLLSYPVLVKRAADIVTSLFVLLLFAPVIAIIALLIKATSRGPVFFRHNRQGLHGKNFHCFKFRSMIVGADELQQKLKVKNEVDGPQFKMTDDPRVTPIGRFLRNSYLDEIPQFFNVLMGNMSVIGPRPSPEAENSLCAAWHDARLSVRPGITGFWQICRTRKAGTDFQEWVYYDSLYVRQLSLKLDLWICWKTAVYLIRTFLKQF
jgi:lipopolysaccharide/colanic/teichoic acid biosynthesis glycosyltransferase